MHAREQLWFTHMQPTSISPFPLLPYTHHYTYIGDPPPVPTPDYGTILRNLTFPASSGVGARQCINVLIVDDVFVEDTESFRLDLVLISGQPVILGTPDSTIVSIFDEDRMFKTVPVIP